MGLLQAAKRQIRRQLGDERRAAPTGNGGGREVIHDGVDRSSGTRIGGQRIALCLRQIGVVIAKVERKDLPAEPDTDVPVGLVRKIPAARPRVIDKDTWNEVGGAEPVVASLAGHIHRDAVRQEVLGGTKLRRTRGVSAGGAGVQPTRRVIDVGAEGDHRIHGP